MPAHSRRSSTNAMKESGMSKGQRGNKEAKKPKKVPPTAKHQLPGDATSSMTAPTSNAPKKR
jgi:hypothetical protein